MMTELVTMTWQQTCCVMKSVQLLSQLVSFFQSLLSFFYFFLFYCQQARNAGIEWHQGVFILNCCSHHR